MVANNVDSLELIKIADQHYFIFISTLSPIRC